MFQGVAVVCISNKTCADLVNFILSKHGIKSILLNEDFSVLIRTIRSRNINLVIIDDDIKGIDCCRLLHMIKNIQPAIEVILYSNNHSLLYEYIKEGILFGCFSMPLNNFEIEQLILSSLGASRRTYKMQSELDELKLKLKNRIIIDKAKEIIARNENISLEKAYRAMQNLSMRKGISIYKLAQIIIEDNENKK